MQWQDLSFVQDFCARDNSYSYIVKYCLFSAELALHNNFMFILTGFWLSWYASFFLAHYENFPAKYWCIQIVDTFQVCKRTYLLGNHSWKLLFANFFYLMKEVIRLAYISNSLCLQLDSDHIWAHIYKN